MKKLILILFSAALMFAQKSNAQALQHGVALSWTDNANPAGTTYDIYRLNGACPATAPTTTTGATHLNSAPITTKGYFDSTTVAGQTYCYFGTAGTGANIGNNLLGSPESGESGTIGGGKDCCQKPFPGGHQWRKFAGGEVVCP